ncbi:Endonuclease/exonuclease/phosphatase [Penicillium angulare]|uniref:Endonuclease/exonuclease/phosphatase n=1 Tax=Penicillium angulare TaxID=116970 RepID=UPI002540A1FC|nr:Endonuclease/exonuclease/phosphatase [Penicillium angulare]KAJ5289126.1 Endonuclease/exonuclease/phosphatase [Penicillium angulare]
MDAIISKAIADSAALRKSSVPWIPDEPYNQSYHAFDPKSSSWIIKSPSPSTSTDTSMYNKNKNEQNTNITKIALYSWNIDFMLPFPEARMKTALSHLNTLISSNPDTSNAATVIYLQECLPSDLEIIKNTPWIQERFHITDLDTTNWATTHYGTIMLIDLCLVIRNVFRVHYLKTRMDRDALFVDIDVSLALNKKIKIRLCTSHLESMAFEPPFRPEQMNIIARHLHDTSVDAGIVAGDFNAIQHFDRTLHVHGDNNLKDAFLELGGEEDTDDGFTWGQQAATELRAKFGCSRMDKVYFCGCVGVSRFGRFGYDVLLEGPEEKGNELVELGFEKPWVTDHLGVMAEVELEVL